MSESEHTELPTALFEGLPEMAVVVDRTGRLRWYNDRVPAVTDRSDAELADARLPALIAPEDRDRVRRALADVEGTVTVTFDVVTPDGPVPHEFDASVLEGDLVGGVVRDVSQRRRLAAELEWYEHVVEKGGDGVYTMDPEGYYTDVNDYIAEVTGYDREAIVGAHASKFLSEADVRKSIEAIERLREDDDRRVATVELEVRTRDGGVVHCEDNISLLPTEDGSFQGTMGFLRDVTDRKTYAESLERQRDELETLNRISATVEDVVRALVDAVTREELEDVVCERLAASELYCSVWIGHAEPGGEVVPATGVADDEAFLDINRDLGDIDDWERPATAAARTGEVAVETRIQECDALPDSVRAAARRFGIRSGAAVPLGHGDRTFGVLVVHSSRPEAFSQREQTAFHRLGEVIGFAINAVQTRRLLVSDTVTELELEVTADDAFFTAITDRFDCRTELEGATTTTDGDRLQYVSVEGIDAETLLSATDAEPSIAGSRVIGEGDGALLLEVTRVDGAYRELIDVSAAVTAATAEDGRGQVVVRAPRSADPRTVVEAFTDVYPGATLLAKREIDRPLRTTAEFRRDLDQRLTEKQRSALQAAYFAGYFDWPRTSTAEELAEGLDISSATLHYHLRRAERELVAALVE